ncbi:Uncharacterised protein [Hafnia alvei]|nr:Uncharacterised protein [Hafnia alvei]
MPTRSGDGISDKSARIEGARAGAPHRTPSAMYPCSSVLIGGRNLTLRSHKQHATCSLLNQLPPLLHPWSRDHFGFGINLSIHFQQFANARRFLLLQQFIELMTCAAEMSVAAIA